MVRVQQQIDLAWPWFAQGAGWQHVTVANAHAVHDANFDVAFQGPMLQSIVTYKDVDLWMLMEQVARCLDPFGPNCNRHLALVENKQWFIAYLPWAAVGLNHLHVKMGTSIAP
jgi:hypothetical protein